LLAAAEVGKALAHRRAGIIHALNRAPIESPGYIRPHFRTNIAELDRLDPCRAGDSERGIALFVAVSGID
jgi:hypothetical protein